MKKLRAILVLIILAEVAAAVWQSFAFERAATRSAAALPAVASAHAAVIEDMIDKHAYGIRADLNRQLGSAIERADKQLTAIRVTADDRMKDALARYDATLARVDKALDEAKPAVDGAVAVEASAQSTLDAAQPALDNLTAVTANTAAITAQTHEYIDENYYDLFALPQAANAMLVGVAQTSLQVGKAAPAVADAVIKEANAITKPKHWYEKAFGPVLDVARILAALL